MNILISLILSALIYFYLPSILIEKLKKPTKTKIISIICLNNLLFFFIIAFWNIAQEGYAISSDTMFFWGLICYFTAGKTVLKKKTADEYIPTHTPANCMPPKETLAADDSEVDISQDTDDENAALKAPPRKKVKVRVVSANNKSPVKHIVKANPVSSPQPSDEPSHTEESTLSNPIISEISEKNVSEPASASKSKLIPFLMCCCIFVALLNIYFLVSLKTVKADIAANELETQNNHEMTNTVIKGYIHKREASAALHYTFLRCQYEYVRKSTDYFDSPELIIRANRPDGRPALEREVDIIAKQIGHQNSFKIGG